MKARTKELVFIRGHKIIADTETYIPCVNILCNKCIYEEFGHDCPLRGTVWYDVLRGTCIGDKLIKHETKK